MDGANIERIAIGMGAVYGVYYCGKNGKSLIWIFLILWLAWGLMMVTFWGGPLLLPDKIFEKPKDPK